MTRKETVLYTLKQLIEKELPHILQDENKRHNDGILLGNFLGVSFDKSMPLPYVKLTIKNCEYTEKDRIFRNAVYEVTVETLIQKGTDYITKLARFEEAFEKLTDEFSTVDDAWEWMEMRGCEENCFILEVRVRLT